MKANRAFLGLACLGWSNLVFKTMNQGTLMTMIPLILASFQFLQEDYSRAPAPRLLKEIQEAKKHIPQLQEQLSKATGSAQVNRNRMAFTIRSGLP